MQLAYDAPATTRLAAHTPLDAIPHGDLADALHRYADRVDIHLEHGYILGRCELCPCGLLDPATAEAVIVGHSRTWAVEVCAACLPAEIDHRIDVLGHDIAVNIPMEQF